MLGFYMKLKSEHWQKSQFGRGKRRDVSCCDVRLSLCVSFLCHRAETERGLSRKHIIEGEVHFLFLKSSHCVITACVCVMCLAPGGALIEWF